MKVTLEFEESDLKEMLTSYFQGNGFAVKNLEEVCLQFNNAYPGGLQVQAEIIPMDPVTHTVYSSHTPSTHPPDAPESDSDDDVIEEVATDSVLSLNDLMDPEPRKGRVVSVVNTTKDEFSDLLTKSKRLENERRKS